ncbi:MAG: response regulator [Spirochaetales bacterium]|nr:response regulator [Spirochaetales bacterium]
MAIEKKPHILIIDDEEIIRDLVVDILEESRYEVSDFSSGEEALKYFRLNSEEIDLVLLDIIMPEMGGSEVFAKLREIDPDVKVILLSGYSRNVEIETLLTWKNTEFFQKPISVKGLLDMVKEQLYS